MKLVHAKIFIFTLFACLSMSPIYAMKPKALVACCVQLLGIGAGVNVMSNGHVCNEQKEKTKLTSNQMLVRLLTKTHGDAQQALVTAVQSGCSGLVGPLKKLGAGVNEKNKSNGRSLLDVAVDRDDVRMMKALLECGAEVQDFHYAPLPVVPVQLRTVLDRENFEAVRLLCKHGNYGKLLFKFGGILERSDNCIKYATWLYLLSDVSMDQRTYRDICTGRDRLVQMLCVLGRYSVPKDLKKIVLSYASSYIPNGSGMTDICFSCPDRIDSFVHAVPHTWFYPLLKKGAASRDIQKRIRKALDHDMQIRSNSLCRDMRRGILRCLQQRAQNGDVTKLRSFFDLDDKDRTRRSYLRKQYRKEFRELRDAT